MGVTLSHQVNNSVNQVFKNRITERFYIDECFMVQDNATFSVINRRKEWVKDVGAGMGKLKKACVLD